MSRIDQINIDAHEGRLDDMRWRIALGEEGRRLEAQLAEKDRELEAARAATRYAVEKEAEAKRIMLESAARIKDEVIPKIQAQDKLLDEARGDVERLVEWMAYSVGCVNCIAEDTCKKTMLTRAASCHQRIIEALRKEKG